MRNFLVKYFALDYITKAFGYTVNFVRPATFIFPLFVLNGILAVKYGYQWWQIITVFPLVVSFFIGFVYFRMYPVHWSELSKEQLFQYDAAYRRNLILPGQLPHSYFLEVADANKYVEENIKEKRFYKPFRFVFHPLILVAISVIITWLML